MRNDKGIVKRSVHFGQESYSQVIKAIKALKGALIRAYLNTKEGLLNLEVEKGTSLENFNDIKVGEKMAHDRRMKVRITPLTPADGSTLQKVFELTLGDFARDVIQVEFRKDSHLTIVFGSDKAKKSFIKLLRECSIPETKPKESFLASITIKG